MRAKPTLMCEVREEASDEVGFLELLRLCGPSHFASAGSKQWAELSALYYDLKAIDRQLEMLVALRPDKEARYEEQHREAQRALEKRAASRCCRKKRCGLGKSLPAIPLNIH